MYIALGALAVLAVLILLPVKRKVLIEGKFQKDKRELGFNASFKSAYCRFFYFEKYCHECMEKWRKTGKEPGNLGDVCSVGVPEKTWNLGLRALERGKSYKLTIYKNVFGTIRAYRIESSDFVWINPRDEEERLGARRNGFTDVGEYRKIRESEWRESTYGELMEEDKLTRDEAESVELDIFNKDSTEEIFEREAKRCGKKFEDVKSWWEKSMKEGLAKETSPCVYLVLDLFGSGGRKYVSAFIERQEIDKELRAHLDQCSKCGRAFVEEIAEETGEQKEEIRRKAGLRPEQEVYAEQIRREHGLTVEEYEKRVKENLILRFGGEHCFKLKERVVFARTGVLSDECLAHGQQCPPCQRMLAADREDFLETGKLGGLAYRALEEIDRRET